MKETIDPYQKKRINFLGCKIDLSQKIFIPRIETEYWVDIAIKEIKKENDKKINVLDMFSGSGCVGLAVLKNIPDSYVDLIDISNKAVSQIKKNLRINKVSEKRYEVYKSDFFKEIRDKKNHYHYIFANPPYVATERIDEVENSVLKYEPKSALLSGKKGLVHIKKFLKQAKYFLKKEGVIYLEFDPRQKQEIKTILNKERYAEIKFRIDQFQKLRWLKTTYN